MPGVIFKKNNGLREALEKIEATPPDPCSDEAIHMTASGWKHVARAMATEARRLLNDLEEGRYLVHETVRFYKDGH